MAVLAAALLALQCSPKDDPITPEPDPTPVTPPDPGPEEPEDLQPLTASILDNDDWVWEGRPAITFRVENPNTVAASIDLMVRISTDQKQTLVTLNRTAEIQAASTQDVVVTTEEDLAPGFYRAACFANKKSTKIFFFGIDPFQIVSAPDAEADFDAFWDAAIAQLEAIDMAPVLTEIPSRSNANAKCYFVELKSVPNGLEGEPETIHGYYLEPQDGKAHPVLMHYYGYDDLTNISKTFCPSGNGQFAEFYLSTRGQVINNRTADLREDGIAQDFVNTYGDWFAFQFGIRDGYYYRGAFMDCVQGIRFMATRPTSDSANIFAEGKSQGGAFSYAAAALSPYPLRAIAPGVAFLGDFPDYFHIVDWPANVAYAGRDKMGMSDEEMYRFLSYFDTKNLATRINRQGIPCAIIANIGLQDGTCPPHTNIAPYNVVTNPDKEMYFYPKMGHSIPSGWDSKITTFFKARVQ